MREILVNQTAIRSTSLFLMAMEIMVMFTLESINYRRHIQSLPDSESGVSIQRGLLSCFMSIYLNHHIFSSMKFVSGGLFHRRHLRFLTDEFSPDLWFGEVIWIFDPGISRQTSLFEEIGLRDNCFFPMARSGDVRSVLRSHCSSYMEQQMMVIHLQRLEGVRRRHNTSSRSSFLFQREADVLTMTSKSRQQLKVMLKAFWSLSYMLLAINIKYMKGGPISHSLIARKAYVQQAGLIHSIIEATASHICEKRLYPSSLSLLYERICVPNLVYPNDVLFCY